MSNKLKWKNRIYIVLFAPCCTALSTCYALYYAVLIILCCIELCCTIPHFGLLYYYELSFGLCYLLCCILLYYSNMQYRIINSVAITHAVLYCKRLYFYLLLCTVLYCTALYCTVSYFAEQYCSVCSKFLSNIKQNQMERIEIKNI